MMLIENKDEIYMLDRSNNIFKINNLQFPNTDFSRHLTDTLIDGVCFSKAYKLRNLFFLFIRNLLLINMKERIYIDI